MQHRIQRISRHFTAWGAMALLLTALPRVAQAANYRWTGGGTTNLWSTPANWEVDDGGWQTATTPPGTGDVAFLGDAAPDAPQEIVLDGDVSIFRLVMQATGEREYVISSLLDGEGEEYTLALTAAIWDKALEQTSGATRDLTLRVPVVLTASSAWTHFLSSNHAKVIVERPMTFSATASSGTLLHIRGADSIPSEPAVGGILELRAPLDTKGRGISMWNAPVVLLNYAGEGSVIVCSNVRLIYEASIWVKQSAQITGAIQHSNHSNQPGRGYFKPYDTGGAHVTLRFSGDANRYGDFDIGPAVPEGAPGSLSVSLRRIDYDGSWPVIAFNLASNAVLDIRQMQSLPRDMENQTAISGEGAVSKTDAAIAVTEIGTTNFYTGGTYVEAGTMRLISGNRPAYWPDGPNVYTEGQIGPGPLRIATGAAFDLNGIDQTISALHGAGTVQLGGATLTATNGVSPGTHSVGTLTVAGSGSLALSGQSSEFEFADTESHDRVVFTGSADLSLGGTLQLVGPEGFAEYGRGRYTLIEMNGGAIAGAFDALIPPDGMEAEIDTLSGDVEVILTKLPTGTTILIR